ncbi:MAG: hypothetical protein M3505_06020 [Verrucomicrobiota bacterium]|nr:hypothetical protein [Verrucomicrobiota bacterium]
MSADASAAAPSDLGGERHKLLRGTGWVVGTFVTSRLLVFWVILLSRKIVIPGEFSRPGELLSVLTQSQGEIYIDLAQHGYSSLSDQQLSIGFFPFYPFLVRLASFIFADVGLAAVVTANLCLLVSAFLLNAMINLDYDNPTANRAALLFLMFSPVSFFFSSAYAESTFLMLALAAFLAARKEKWLLASLCGMCLAATRNAGLLIAVPLLLEYFRQTRSASTRLPKLSHLRILFFALVPLGSGYFLWAGYVNAQDPLAYFHARVVWGEGFFTQRWQLPEIWNLPPFYIWFPVGALVTSMLLMAGGWFLKVRDSYLLYAVLLFALCLCSVTPESIPRNLSVVFPLFIILGVYAARFERFLEPLFAASVAALAFCTMLAANGYWMT